MMSGYFILFLKNCLYEHMCVCVYKNYFINSSMKKS